MSKRPTIPKEAYVPNSVDPTDEDYPLEGPTISGCFGKIINILIYILAGIGFLAIMSSMQGKPTAAPAKAPTMSDILPSLTPSPTITQTLIPGITPTITLTPSATNIPSGALATWTPGPWMLTRFFSTVEPITATPIPSNTPASTATENP